MEDGYALVEINDIFLNFYSRFINTEKKLIMHGRETTSVAIF